MDVGTETQGQGRSRSCSWHQAPVPASEPAWGPGAHQSQACLLCPRPELPTSEHLSVADATWLALNVVSGGGSFSSSQPIGVTKIAKSVIAPLADQNISVFMLSTYQTDFILVSYSSTSQALGVRGHTPFRHGLLSSVASVP